MRILAISGSLRKDSYNTALLNKAKEMVPSSVSFQVKTLHGIPLYNGDDEAVNGLPASVVALQTEIAQADAVLIATPEYNGSMPGVLKNAIDWASRPFTDGKSVFVGKPVAVIGASPSGFGTILGQEAWLPVLRSMGTRPWFGGRLMVSKAYEVFDNDGNMTDHFITESLKEYMNRFVHDFSK